MLTPNLVVKKNEMRTSLTVKRLPSLEPNKGIKKNQ